MVPPPERPLPLAFQLLATNGWCGVFVDAMRSFPKFSACRVFEITAHDEDGEETGQHWVLELPDGQFLDAEGIRDAAELERIWKGFPEPFADEGSSFLGRSCCSLQEMTQNPVALVTEILRAHGWDCERIPFASQSRNVSDELPLARHLLEQTDSLTVAESFALWATVDGAKEDTGIAAPSTVSPCGP